MKMEDIEKHWRNWANEFDVDLRATTKTSTIKELEVNALYSAIVEFQPSASTKETTPLDILEVGSGNGHNCFSLSKRLTKSNFTGVDFISEMVSSANKQLATYPDQKQFRFFEGNILKLQEHPNLKKDYDVVFTDRCIINVNSHELQNQAFDNLLSLTRGNGLVVLIENIKKTYDDQNQLRTSVGLPARTPDSFNLFLDEDQFLFHCRSRATLMAIKDFGSLHDLVLYVLVPMINDGKTDYDHPIVKATTQLLLNNDFDLGNSFGHFGQNRLYVFKKEI